MRESARAARYPYQRQAARVDVDFQQGMALLRLPFARCLMMQQALML
jgi:hypothetical protein